MDRPVSIKKILIANRGEIALRIMQTCRELGITGVTLHTESEKNYPHVQCADESYSLGEGDLSDTYLNQEKIIDMAKKAKVCAIHPGYGLLSENADFNERVRKAKLIFIGPSPENVVLMGSKKESKKSMEAIGVPVIPGYHGEDQKNEFLLAQAKKIGFPLLIKASAGGGGKGMRIVAKEGDFSHALAGARREAMNAFGDDSVILEKFITNPRHIEVQVMGDTHGNHFHFYERDCSIQRRYQKIIEEAPAIRMDESLREKITQTAVHIAKSINYEGSGTVEFVLDETGTFYFLEMNTRLQVEHTITEMVTGFDLVALQIKIAAGERMSFKQEDIAIRGHAMELRLYAEDPDRSFLPQTGTLSTIGSSSVKNVRFDCGYIDGNEVTVNFDPMMAKLSVWADNREACIRKASHVLEDIPFLGVKSNRDYLRRIMEHKKFREGMISTRFVEKHKDDLLPKPIGKEDEALLLACYIFLKRQYKETGFKPKAQDTWDNLVNFRAF